MGGDEEGTAGGERLGTPGVWGEEGEVGAREEGKGMEASA